MKYFCFSFQLKEVFYNPKVKKGLLYNKIYNMSKRMAHFKPTTENATPVTDSTEVIELKSYFKHFTIKSEADLAEFKNKLKDTVDLRAAWLKDDSRIYDMFSVFYTHPKLVRTDGFPVF